MQRTVWFLVVCLKTVIFLIPHAENGATEEWPSCCSGTWGGRDAIQLYLVYLQIDGLFFFQDEVMYKSYTKGSALLNLSIFHNVQHFVKELL